MNNVTMPAADREIDARLAVVQEAVSVLANPIPVLEDIEAELDILNDEAADPDALNAIHNNAVTLLDSQQRLATAFMTTLELAKALKDQREQARQRLADLKEAIDNADTSVPEIESLWEMVEESNMEWLMYSFDDEWERPVEDLINTTPLDEDEAHSLINVLIGQDLPQDHYLWDELRDWIRRAEETALTGICPPPAASNE